MWEIQTLIERLLYLRECETRLNGASRKFGIFSFRTPISGVVPCDQEEMPWPPVLPREGNGFVHAPRTPSFLRGFPRKMASVLIVFELWLVRHKLASLRKIEMVAWADTCHRSYPLFNPEGMDKKISQPPAGEGKSWSAGPRTQLLWDQPTNWHPSAQSWGSDKVWHSLAAWNELMARANRHHKFSPSPPCSNRMSGWKIHASSAPTSPRMSKESASVLPVLKSWQVQHRLAAWERTVW